MAGSYLECYLCTLRSDVIIQDEAQATYGNWLKVWINKGEVLPAKRIWQGER